MCESFVKVFFMLESLIYVFDEVFSKSSATISDVCMFFWFCFNDDYWQRLIMLLATFVFHFLQHFFLQFLSS